MKDFFRNRLAQTTLIGLYIAIESYSLHLLAVYAFRPLRLPSVGLEIVAIIAAYLITDIIRYLTISRRKKLALAAVIVVISLALATGLASLMLYMDKLQLEASFK